MDPNNIFSQPPFNTFPFNHALNVIDKMEYLGEEASPYEVSPGLELCLSDTYYSLNFLHYLHSFGRLVTKDDKWLLDPKGEPEEEKPYRYGLIAEAAEILRTLSKGSLTIPEILSLIPDIPEEKLISYLTLLRLLCQKGKITQLSKGWDSTYILEEW